VHNDTVHNDTAHDVAPHNSGTVSLYAASPVERGFRDVAW
jgi:hypothetical protein